jgi:hypothetical protein
MIQPTKPVPPEIVQMRETAVPGESTHMTYLITGGVVLLCFLLLPLLLTLWLIGWMWHSLGRWQGSTE